MARGTGLGLSICKHFLNLMGGSLEVTSELRMGTAITLHIPIDFEVSKLLTSHVPLHCFAERITDVKQWKYDVMHAICPPSKKPYFNLRY